MLIASGGSDDEPSAAAVGAPTDTPTVATLTSTPAPTDTPRPTSTPVPPLPDALQDRLNALPQKLRNETLQAYVAGTLSLEQLEQIATDYENRNPSVRVGSVVSVAGGLLRFEVFTTGEQAEVSTGEQTLIRRGDAEIALADLLPEELIMVVSTAEGAVALTIEAFGVVAP